MERYPSRLRVGVLLGAGVVALSFASILIRLTEAPSLAIAAGRMTLASLALAPLFWPRLGRMRIELRARDWLLVALSGVFLAAHFALWIESLNHTSVTSSVVLVAMDPIFVAVAAPFVLREKVSWRTGAAVGLGCAGTAVIAGPGLASGLAGIGNLLALGGAACAAGYLLVGRSVRQRMGLLAYVYVMYTVAALLLLGVVAVARVPLVGYSVRTYGLILLLAIGPQLIGHTSFNWALRYLSAPAVAMGILGEPVGATILSWIVLREPPTMPEAAGGVIIGVGVYLALSGREPPSVVATD